MNSLILIYELCLSFAKNGTDFPRSIGLTKDHFFKLKSEAVPYSCYVTSKMLEEFNSEKPFYLNLPYGSLKIFIEENSQ